MGDGLGVEGDAGGFEERDEADVEEREDEHGRDDPEEGGAGGGDDAGAEPAGEFADGEAAVVLKEDDDESGDAQLEDELDLHVEGGEAGGAGRVGAIGDGAHDEGEADGEDDGEPCVLALPPMVEREGFEREVGWRGFVGFCGGVRGNRVEGSGEDGAVPPCHERDGEDDCEEDGLQDNGLHEGDIGRDHGPGLRRRNAVAGGAGAGEREGKDCNMMKTRLLMMSCVLAGVVLPLRGEDAKPREAAGPPAVTEYKGRKVAQTMHWTGAEWLLRANREQEENAALMLEELKIKPGWTVCDLGCGNGYHALTMARTVGEKGSILAVDIQVQMLELLKARAEGRGLKNIRTIQGEAWDPKLPEASCDLILLVDVYHEFSHPEEQMKALRRALKPEGRIALVEFREEDETVPIRPEHKMSKVQILKEWLPMGFELDRSFDELPWQHLMFLRKAEAKPAAKAEGAKPESAR